MAGNFALGALMMLGIGLYAPCMIMVALLGMDPTRGVPDHDGLVRVPDADLQHPVRPRAELSRSGVLGPCAWRLSRRAHRCVHRPLTAARRGQLARRAVVIYTSLNMLLTARMEDPAERAVVDVAQDFSPASR